MKYSLSNDDDDVSVRDSVSSAGSSRSNSTTSSDTLRAKASAEVAKMMLSQIEKEHQLEEEMIALKKRMAILKASHQADRANAELTVYNNDEDDEFTRQHNGPPQLQYSCRPAKPQYRPPQPPFVPSPPTLVSEQPSLVSPQSPVVPHQPQYLSPQPQYEPPQPAFVPTQPPSVSQQASFMSLQRPVVSPQPQYEPLQPQDVPPQPPSVSPQPQYVPTQPYYGPQFPTNAPSMPPDQFLNFLQAQQMMIQNVASLSTMPKPDITQFDGNPLNYWTFIRTFEEVIEKKSLSESEKLNFLLQYCNDNVKKIINNCVLLSPNNGYTEARNILHERYGDPYVIACASVDKVTNGPPLRQNDRKGLQAFGDELNDCAMTLNSIGYIDEINSSDNLRKIAERFPHHLKGKWLERVRAIREVGRRPRIDDIAVFVTQSARAVNDPVFGQIMENKHNKDDNSRRPQRVKNFVVQINKKEDKDKPQENPRIKSPCLMCKNTSHYLTKCEMFHSKSHEDKIKFLKENKVCFNCFKVNHVAKKCYKGPACEVKDCGKKHQTCIHPPENSQERKETSAKTPEVLVNNNMALRDTARVCLPIVPVRVCGNNGKIIETYALLDNGSDTSLCEESLVEVLGITGKKHSYSLNTIDSPGKQKSGHIVNLKIMPMDSDKVIELLSVVTVKEIPVGRRSLASEKDIDKWPHLKDIDIPEVCGDVSLLIGNDVPEAFWKDEERRGGPKEPYAIKSILGWTVIGPVESNDADEVTINLIVNGDDDPLLQQVKKFWQIDEKLPSKTQTMSVEDKVALKKMEDSVKRVNGHYQLSLPWKHPNPYLPSNKYLAANRLQVLKRRFIKDDKLFSKYKTSIHEYVDKGYAQQVPPDQLNNKERVWYIPHHGVINPNKPDKVRVVFDCSAKYQGTSLNDQLLQGPDLTNSLFGVLTRFRQESIAIMADVEGMFNQVYVDPQDIDALRFLWWPDDDVNKEPVDMQMLVHLFGATSSPSCANYSLRKTAEDNKQDFKPETSETIKRNFYVDDMLKSVKTPGEAITLTKELKAMLNRGGFNLTKWTSNDKDVINSIEDSDKAKSVKNLSLDDNLPTERALGVVWNIKDDKLTIKSQVPEKPVTRRGILSATSSVYDPLGIVSPFILPAKKIMQDLCRESHGWDEPVPQESMSRWERWLEDLPKLSSVQIDRCIKPKNFGEVVKSELHTFSDASQTGYGAVSYIRLINSEGDVHCSFLAAKSRLAPLKAVTIPRLELSAAVVAVELEGQLRQELEIPIDESIFWTDSTSVLQYINNTKRRFKVYVANRIATIHDGSNPNQWKYVPTKENPADDASRGLTADEMLKSKRWLNGPKFLWETNDSWPEQPNNLPDVSQDDNEVKKEVQAFNVSVNKDEGEAHTDKLINHFSSWYKLKKSTAWLLRYKSYIMSKHRKEKKQENCYQVPLSVEELQQAEIEIIKYEQRKYYNEEITRLKSNSPIQQTSKIIRLNPQVKNEVLVVGGRLSNAAIEEAAKHQIILPKDSHVSNLLVNFYHELSGHCGKEHVLSLLREKYWIMTARAIVRKVLSKCIVCKRQHSRPAEQLMSDLPEDRVTPNKPPFTYVGIDCFGPMLVKQGRSQVKRYGCIFTCLATRAVHLEVLHNMDTDSFINGLNRFINRRGKPEVIRCDNGTNFKGSQRELSDEIKKWNQRKIQESLKQQEIKWKFNPPAASNFGGAWERLIKSVKTVLKVLLKNEVLTDEVLSTLVIQVEGIMNSRPITPYSDDPRDKEPLTPNHLLLMRNQSLLPSAISSKEDTYTRRWKQVQFLADQFWKRWLKEYLPSLQERQKWLMRRTNLKTDDLVLIFDEKTPRGQWPLGRVIEVYKGRDGLVRSAKIAFKDGVLHRPVNKLCLVANSDTSQPSIQEQESSRHPGTRVIQASRNKTSTKHRGAR